MYFQSDIRNSIPLVDNSIDVGLSDPPFSIDFDGRSSVYNRKKENVADGYQEFELEKILFVISEWKRILKQNGTFCLVMGWNALPHWNMEFLKQGFYQIGHVIWKYQFCVYTKKKPVTSHYHILFFAKNKNNYTWNQQGYDEDVWDIKRPYKKGGLKYPNKLPDKVVEEILIRISNKGDIVYDGFVGSGTIVKVCNRLGRIGIGSDIKYNKEFWSNV